MADPALLAEAYRRGLLPPAKRAAYEEGVRRGLVKDPYAQARIREDRIARPKGLDGGFTDQVVRKIGLGDEIQGGTAFLAQGAENVFRRATGRDVEVPASVAYRAGADASNAARDSYARQRPVMNALATGAGVAAAGAPVRGVVNVLANPIRTGVQAAAANLPFAVGRQEGGVAERLPGAAAETAIAFGAGAALQGVGNALTRGAARVRARPPSQARQLANEGVTLTPGQMAGGVAKRAEDVLTSAPLTGASINARRAEGLADFNRAAYNRALSPIGRSVSAADDVGREGVGAVRREISAAYTQALNGVQVAPDQQFAAEVTQAVRAASPAVRKEVQDLVDGIVGAQFTGPITGQAWKAVDEQLGAAIASARTGAARDPVKRFTADALIKVRQAHQGVLQRVNPQAAQAVSQADEAFANFARIRQGAQSIGADEGVFTPAQLQRAVQAGDASAGNGQFAQGDALMQDLSEAGKSVLPSKVPDSGTALRLATGAGLYGGITGAVSPGAALAAVGADVAGSAIYSRPVIELLNRVYRASSPGQAREALSRLASLASRDPALVPAYEAALRQLGLPLPPNGGPQGGPRSQPQPMTR